MYTYLYYLSIFIKISINIKHFVFILTTTQLRFNNYAIYQLLHIYFTFNFGNPSLTAFQYYAIKIVYSLFDLGKIQLLCHFMFLYSIVNKCIYIPTVYLD